MKRRVVIGVIALAVILRTGVSAAGIDNENRITLNVNGGYIGSGYIGTESKIELITEKGKIKLPLPYRTSDYEFIGWYTEDGEKVNSDTQYCVDTVLTAKWETTGTRRINFSSDGGSDILPITAEYGSKVNISSLIPTKQGFIFKGWYTDPRTKENRVTEITLSEDITVYAKWEQISKMVNVIGKDPIYRTDAEIAMQEQMYKSQYQTTVTNTQIMKLMQVLRQMLMAKK